MEQRESGGELQQAEEAITGTIVEANADRLIVRDEASTNEVSIRIDDRTPFTWRDPNQRGRFTDTARVRIGYYVAGGIHTAREVIVLDAGDGADVGDRIVNVVH